MGIPRDPLKAIHRLVDWQLAPIDVCALDDGRRFVCMLSAGPDGRILQMLESSRDGGTMHMAQYIPLGLKALKSADTRNVRVLIDGQVSSEGLSYALVANTRSFGGPIEFTSRADHADGHFDMLMVEGSMRLKYAPLMAAAFVRRVSTFPGARIQRGRWFRLETSDDRETPFQLDGEFGGVLPVEGRMIQHGLTILGGKPADV